MYLLYSFKDKLKIVLFMLLSSSSLRIAANLIIPDQQPKITYESYDPTGGFFFVINPRALDSQMNAFMNPHCSVGLRSPWENRAALNDNGDVIGVIIYRRCRSSSSYRLENGYGYIEYLRVDEKYRNQQIESTLVEFAKNDMDAHTFLFDSSRIKDEDIGNIPNTTITELERDPNSPSYKKITYPFSSYGQRFRYHFDNDFKFSTCIWTFRLGLFAPYAVIAGYFYTKFKRFRFIDKQPK